MANPDINFIKPFIDGIVETLQVQCKTSAEYGKPFRRGQGPLVGAAISATIRPVGGRYDGTISLYFPKETFLALMNRMLDEKFLEITPDLQDGAAELLNIIFGWAKRKLNAQGFQLEKALPCVAVGPDLETPALNGGPAVILPFSSDAGPFHVEFAAADVLGSSSTKQV